MENEYNKGVLIKLVFTATISCFLTGFNIGVFKSSQINISETLKWGGDKDFYASASNFAFAMGGAVGSALAGKLANKKGRRSGMMITALINIVACGTVIFT